MGTAHPELFLLPGASEHRFQSGSGFTSPEGLGSESASFPAPCRPCAELGPLGGWARWSQRRELGNNPVGPGSWDGSDPAPATTFDPQCVSHSQAWVWPDRPQADSHTRSEFLGLIWGIYPGQGAFSSGAKEPRVKAASGPVADFLKRHPGALLPPRGVTPAQPQGPRPLPHRHHRDVCWFRFPIPRFHTPAPHVAGG